MEIILRDYQQYYKDEFFKCVSDGLRNICIALQTGGGKTYLSAAIAKEYIKKGEPVIFIAPRINLVYQTVKSFEHLGRVQVIQGNKKYDHNGLIYIASMQTLVRRELTFKPSLIIHDERHFGIAGKSSKTILNKFKDAIYLSLTATPFDNRGIPYDDHFEKIIRYKTTQWFINNGYLCDCDCFAPVLPDLSKVKITGGDYNEKDLDNIMNNEVMIGNIIEETKDRIIGKKTLFFAVTISHAEEVAAQYTAIGFSAMAYHSKMDDDIREKIIEDFRNGDIDILVSVTALVMGFDVPSVNCMIIARPTKSQSFYRQLIGRGMRISEGKDYCLLIDCAGTIKENGFPNQEVIPKIAKKKEKKVMTCYKCKGKAEQISKSVKKIKGVLNYVTTWACKKNHTFETFKEVGGTLCPKCSKMIIPGGAKFKEQDDEYLIFAICDCGEEIVIRSIPKVVGKLARLKQNRVAKFTLLKKIRSITKEHQKELVTKFCNYIMEVIHPKMQESSLSSLYVSLEMGLPNKEVQDALMQTIVDSAIKEGEFKCLSSKLIKIAYNQAKDPADIIKIHNSRAIKPMNGVWEKKTINALREFEIRFPESKSWILSSVKTRCQNIHQKNQKMSSLFYFFEFLTKRELEKIEINNPFD